MKRSTERKSRLKAPSKKVRAIVIGSSAGGLHALSACLSPIPKTFPVPILVVQHMHPSGTPYWADLLGEKCRVAVREASDKEPLVGGTVFLAPPNYHLLVEDDLSISLSVNEKVNFARPSVDVLFESASDVFLDELVGIVLTGANQDGAQGLKYLKANGGTAIVQDPETAEYDTMPKAALAATPVDHVLTLSQIGQFLVSLDMSSTNERGMHGSPN